MELPAQNTNISLRKHKPIFVIFLTILFTAIGVSVLVKNVKTRSTIDTSSKALQAKKNDVTLRISPAMTTLKVGQSAPFDVIIHAPNKSVDGVDVVISYDPSLLEAISGQSKLKPGTIFPLYPKNKIDPVKGKIYLTGVTLVPKPTPIPTDVSVGQIVLRGKKAGKGSLHFEFITGRKNLSTVIESETSINLLQSVYDGSYEVVQ